MKKLTAIISLSVIGYLNTAQAETTIVASGDDCGTDCHWSVNSDGVLSVTGTGAINNYGESYDSKTGHENQAPWGAYTQNVSSIVIGEGITSVGNDAFFVNNATKISLPNTLTDIGSAAFRRSYKLNDITIPASVTNIADQAFDFDPTLFNITFEGKIPQTGTGWISDTASNVVISYNEAYNKLEDVLNMLQTAEYSDKGENPTHSASAKTNVKLKAYQSDGTYKLYDGDTGAFIEHYKADGTLNSQKFYTVATAQERIDEIGGCEELKCSLTITFK